MSEAPSWVARCISCGRPLQPGVLLCPSCGAINTRAAREAPGRSWRILWRTYTVHSSNEWNFMTIDGHYLYAGTRVSVTRGRWIASNVLGAIAGLFFVLLTLYFWALSGEPLFLVLAIPMPAVVLFTIYFLVWSLR